MTRGSRYTAPIDYSSVFPNDPDVATLLNTDRIVIDGLRHAGLVALDGAAPEVLSIAKSLDVEPEVVRECLGVLAVSKDEIYSVL